MSSLTNLPASLIRRFGAVKVIGVCALILIILIVSITHSGTTDVALEETPATQAVRTVSLYTISPADTGTAVRSTDGSAFIVRAESSGKIERIAQVGDYVTRGAVVAQLENSAQRGAVLQAQGAYEAALAASNQSDVGQGSAERAYAEALTQAANTFRSTFAASDNVLRNTVDQVFSNADTPRPGLRINGQGQTLSLNTERVVLEGLFDDWRGKMDIASGENAQDLLAAAEERTTRLNTFVLTLTSLLSDEDALSDTVELERLRGEFASARATLSGVLASLSSARSTLIAAETAKKQADIAGSTSDISLSDAQVKQALGVLESARAALGKTSVKSPVSGTVTAVSISVGDIITTGSDVVFVASDAHDAMEVTDTVTVPLTSVKFTPSKAFVFTVENGKLVAHEVKTGSVTTKSIAVSGLQGITDIVLDVRGLKEGDTVSYQVESL